MSFNVDDVLLSIGYGIVIIIGVLLIGIMFANIIIESRESRKDKEKRKKLINSLYYYRPNLISYEIQRDISKYYDTTIRTLYEYDRDLAKNLLERALYYSLNNVGNILNKHPINNEINYTIMNVNDINSFIYKLTKYTEDICYKLNLNDDVYFKVEMGNYETEHYYLHGIIDIITRDKIIKVIYKNQYTGGKDLYKEADYYIELYAASHYTNKSIRFNHPEELKLCVLNLLTNEFIEYDKIQTPINLW